jgi:hypothetical protein
MNREHTPRIVRVSQEPVHKAIQTLEYIYLNKIYQFIEGEVEIHAN